MEETLYKLLKGALLSVKVPEIGHEFYSAAKKMGYVSFTSNEIGSAIAYKGIKITQKGLEYLNQIRTKYETDEPKPKGKVVKIDF